MRGRPVLAETPALAHEKRQDFVVMMATLMDPARVAVRVDLAPLYTDNDGAAEALAPAGRSSADPGSGGYRFMDHMRR